MAFVYKDRVAAFWTGTGTGNIVVGSVPDASYQAFVDALADGDTCDITIYGAGDFETCRATWTESTTTLARGTIYESSNGGARVNFGSGRKVVAITPPASKARPFVLAVDYGVKADGATDDTAALQAADDAAVAARKALMLPAGDILLLGTITPGEDSHWFGQGRNLTTIAANHASNTTFNVRNTGFKISDLTITHFVARTASALTFDINFDLETSAAGNATIRDINVRLPGTSFKFNAAGGEIVVDNVHIHHPVANGIDFDIYDCLIASILNCESGHNDSARGQSHVRARNIAGQLQILNSNFFDAEHGFYSTPGNGQNVVLVTCESTFFDSNPTSPCWVVPTGTGTFGRMVFTNGWLGGSTGYTNFSGSGTNITEVQISKTRMILDKAGGVCANFAGVANLQFDGNVLYNTSVTAAAAATFDGVLGGDVSANLFMAAHPVGFFVAGTTDRLFVHHHNFLSPLITTPISNSASGTNNRWVDNIGLQDSPSLAVANGGTGAATLTGLVQGNGTSAMTAVTNSTTVGQCLRVTGSATYGWGALDLSDTDAITGDLPFANLTQGSARSLLGVTGNATADVASIQSGAAGQIMNSTSSAVAWTATPTLGVAGATRGTLTMAGNTSGSQVWQAAAAASGTITWPGGTVDFSSTGGTSKFVKQASSGAVFTVVQPDLSDLSGLGSNVATFLGTPTSANLAAAVTNETGSGLLVFGTAPTLTGRVDVTYSTTSGSGNNRALDIAATRTVTSGTTDDFSGLTGGITDASGSSTTPASTAAMRFTNTYSNSSNTSPSNYGISNLVQVTANLTSYIGYNSGATLFGGTLGTYTAFRANAPAAAGGSVTTKYAFVSDASAGAIVQNDTTEATTTSDGSIATAGGLSVVKNIIGGAKVRCGSYVVASLPSGSAGDMAFASNCRVFNGAGTQEGAGVGTGGLVTHNGTAWKIAGTNVTAVA